MNDLVENDFVEIPLSRRDRFMRVVRELMCAVGAHKTKKVHSVGYTTVECTSCGMCWLEG
jgi:hypothetical protein